MPEERVDNVPINLDIYMFSNESKGILMYGNVVLVQFSGLRVSMRNLICRKG